MSSNKRPRPPRPSQSRKANRVSPGNEKLYSQRMFVNDEYFRQISQICDYFIVFKNPRNSSEIRTLAQQITPGSLHLIKIYIEATKDPFSYLFINLTQECEPEVKYLSQIFSKDHSVKAFVEST